MKKFLLSSFILILFNFGLFAQGSNNALDFRNDSYVNLNSIAPDVAHLTSFTIEFWIRLDLQQNNNGGELYSANTSDYGNRMVIRLSGPSDGVQSRAVVLLAPTNTTHKYIVGDSMIIGDNRCHHIAFTYDNQACSLYVDGVLDGTLNYYFEFKPSDMHSLGQEWDANPNVTSEFYNGEMDEFRIWNLELCQNTNSNTKREKSRINGK